MRYGPIVAERYRKQYFKRKKWAEYDDWQLQPEQIYTVLLELKTKEAINALMGNKSWIRKLPKSPQRSA